MPGERESFKSSLHCATKRLVVLQSHSRTLTDLLVDRKAIQTSVQVASTGAWTAITSH
jgi:hypothetical protein